MSSIIIKTGFKGFENHLDTFSRVCANCSISGHGVYKVLKYDVVCVVYMCTGDVSGSVIDFCLATWAGKLYRFSGLHCCIWPHFLAATLCSLLLLGQQTAKTIIDLQNRRRLKIFSSKYML